METNKQDSNKPVVPMFEYILWIATEEKESNKIIKTIRYCLDLISNCPNSISVNQTNVRPTKQAVINALLEIKTPTKIAKDRIYWK